MRQEASESATARGGLQVRDVEGSVGQSQRGIDHYQRDRGGAPARRPAAGAGAPAWIDQPTPPRMLFIEIRLQTSIMLMHIKK